jgi:hypothetical protein
VQPSFATITKTSKNNAIVFLHHDGSFIWHDQETRDRFINVMSAALGNTLNLQMNCKRIGDVKVKGTNLKTIKGKV